MVLLFLRLPQKHGSATLGLHARAPGCSREPGSFLGSDVARRGRRGPLRRARVGSQGSPWETSQPSTRKVTAGHQCPWPSSEVRPSPCAEGAARSKEGAPSGTSGDRTLREPSGFHRVLRDLGGTLPAPREPRDCREVFRDHVGDLRVPGKSSGFHERARLLSPRTFGSKAGLSPERSRPLWWRSLPSHHGSGCRWNQRPARRGRPGKGCSSAGACLPGAPQRAAVYRRRRYRPRQVRCRSSAGRKRPRRLPCAGALTGSTRRRGTCPPPGHRRESDLSNPAPRLLWGPSESVNKILGTGSRFHQMWGAGPGSARAPHDRAHAGWAHPGRSGAPLPSGAASGKGITWQS
jgi:hypothetical protein